VKCTSSDYRAKPLKHRGTEESEEWKGFETK
jgi:hypothetical protein